MSAQFIKLGLASVPLTGLLVSAKPKYKNENVSQNKQLIAVLASP
jgi:hypothetical protein